MTNFIEQHFVVISIKKSRPEMAFFESFVHNKTTALSAKFWNQKNQTLTDNSDEQLMYGSGAVKSLLGLIALHNK